MMRSKLINMCIVVFLVFCGCHSHKEVPFWKDITKSQVLNFLNSQGVTAKELVVNNAGGFELDLRGSDIADLNLLEGMPIEILLLSETPVDDISPLREMRYIRKLDIANTKVSDLAPLRGLPIHELNITKTKITDLSPVKDMPIRVLSLVQTEVNDFSPLEFLDLHEIYFSVDKSYTEKSVNILRNKKSLRCINYYGRVNDFWSDYDAGKIKPRRVKKVIRE